MGSQGATKSFRTPHDSFGIVKPALWRWIFGNPNHTWLLIPLSKWVITPVINGISRVNPLLTGVIIVITHLLSGMSHQVLEPSASFWESEISVAFQGPATKYTGCWTPQKRAARKPSTAMRCHGSERCAQRRAIGYRRFGLKAKRSVMTTQAGYDIHSSPWKMNGPNRNRWFTY